MTGQEISNKMCEAVTRYTSPREDALSAKGLPQSSPVCLDPSKGITTEQFRLLRSHLIFLV